MTGTRPRLVVAGHGMVGHRLLEEVAARGLTADWEVVAVGEEPRPAYDRVALSSYLAGTSEADLSLVTPGFFETSGIGLRLGQRVDTIDAVARTVGLSGGEVLAYDRLVLATGSYPFVPPMPGTDLPGVFVYRTIDDLDAIAAWAGHPGVVRGVVIGGGLLGLEAANALLTLGLETSVVELAPRLMPVQLDDAGAAFLRRRIEALGVAVHTGFQTAGLAGRGRVERVDQADGDGVPTDIVVVSAGIRPRDDLAGAAGLALGERGGILVDDRLRTSAPEVWAIGECAAVAGRCYGLVAPGYQMAAAVADQLAGIDRAFTGADLSTKLKLLGVDVASVGDAHAAGPGAVEIVVADPLADTYRKLVVDPGTGQVVGAVLVGDASLFGTVTQMARGTLPSPPAPVELLHPAPSGDGRAVEAGALGALGEEAVVCSCNQVTKATICGAVSGGARGVGEVKAGTRAGTTCGGCLPLLTAVVNAELEREGVAVARGLCEHFDLTRPDLYDIIRVRGYTTFSEVVGGHGRGRGCEVCRPVVASILASLGTGHILDGEQAALQDTNDHFLANLQRNGTYSVVPRLPGGEVTPEQLIAIGEVARDFGLYTKITGGQRVDLFGARVEQLPAIWQRLVDAGLESGHAYGKALRTVKSCVGQTWCRYGVQDSTTMAIDLERRYRGLRAPHKIKMAVSGCVRECAEAQSKDVGVIATEKGWNLFVAGNGGARPQHAVLLAADLDDEALVRTIDRFLMYYIRTADRLERTATWFNRLDGGIDRLRAVVLDDCLGIGDQVEADMARHVAAYECEWAATLTDPDRLRHFVTFVNAPGAPDPDIAFVEERGQPRPARDDERALVGGP